MFDPNKAADELRSFVDPLTLVDPLEALRTHVANLRLDVDVNQTFLDDLREQLADAEEALEMELDARCLTEGELAEMDYGRQL